MFDNKIIIPVVTSFGTIDLTIFGENSAVQTIFEKSDANENGEAKFQLKEGHFYEYKIKNGFCLEASDIISQSKVNESSGRISPNIYVGTLSIPVLKSDSKERCGEVRLEIQSVKTSYREDYRHMLEEITEKCTELLLQHSSPVSQFFEIDFNADANTLYQRFAFVKAMLDTDEFNDSLHKILLSPVTTWKERETIKDVRSIRRFNGSAIRQICGADNRIDLPDMHPLRSLINSIPSKVRTSLKTETVDTPENRFVKHALLSFESFCSNLKSRLKENDRLKLEVTLLEDRLEQYLSHSVFKEISSLTALPLNSPILQRKEGYREILRIWLMFDLAAKLVWHGGDDVYSGNKRDVAVLYEYWLFFKLLEIIHDVFNVDALSTENLLESTSDGLGLKLRQGKFLPVKGVYVADTRKLNIEFSYNRTFSGGNKYPDGGSWTRNLRPDYTLSVWPLGVGLEQAEKEELIVHIHFDAKYKIEDLQTIFGKEGNLEEEKEEQKRGTYKRADILKMHTYRDAIRRTAGAYVLYPGTISDNRQGFHELLPGLGAFAIKPSKGYSGTDSLKKFLKDVVRLFLNRASQREKMSFKTYETYKDDDISEVNEALPETYGLNRNLLPDNTFILVAYYKKEQWNWIMKTGLYNARAESNRGSLRLGPGEAGAKYLLLHSEGELITNKLLKIVETGPRIFSKQTLINKGYSNPSQDFYLVYKIEEVHEEELLNRSWDISKLSGYKKGRESALPFSTSLTELMKVVVKRQ